MASLTQTTMNNLDRMFTTDPAAFAAAYLDYVQAVLRRIDAAEVARFIATLLDARERGATIFFAGNGGSAATASHFANDVAIGNDEYKRPFRAISLADNMPMITAISNDVGYEEVFVRQLRVLGKKGDVLVASPPRGILPTCCGPSTTPAPPASRPWPSPPSMEAR